MNYERLLDKTTWCLSLLLGQASALLGVMLTLGWTIALVLIVPPKGTSWELGPRLLLPVEPPLIGLATGALGLLVARCGRQGNVAYAVAGLILNALPLAFAIFLLACRRAG